MENTEEIFLNYATEYFRTETDSNYTMAINLENFKKLIAENFTPKVSRVDAEVSVKLAGVARLKIPLGFFTKGEIKGLRWCLRFDLDNIQDALIRNKINDLEKLLSKFSE